MSPTFARCAAILLSVGATMVVGSVVLISRLYKATARKRLLSSGEWRLQRVIEELLGGDLVHQTPEKFRLSVPVYVWKQKWLVQYI